MPGCDTRLVTQQRANRAMAKLDVWSARFSKHADELGSTHTILLEPKLTPFDHSTVTRAYNSLATSMLWVDDGKCASRAFLGTARINDHARVIGALTDSAFGAATVFAPGVDPYKRGWGFHAATIVQEQGRPTPTVIDPLLYSKPVPLPQWTKRLGADPEKLTVRLMPSNAFEYQRTTKSLSSSWERIVGWPDHTDDVRPYLHRR